MTRENCGREVLCDGVLVLLMPLLFVHQIRIMIVILFT